MGNKNLYTTVLPCLTFTTLYLAFLLLHLSNTLAINSPSPYKPVDNIILNCGSSDNSTALDGQSWNGDVNSKFFPQELSQNQASLATNSAKQSSSAWQVPYTTARLSVSPFTYIFPLTTGQKFVRLYFYPATYSNFDRSNALFSVKAGTFTLLRDFNASLTADADGDPDDTIFREFCIDIVEDLRLNITFTPRDSNSFAFINGIEILSMPSYLYYTPDDDKRIPLIGEEYRFSVDNRTALETIYRINVGGKYISPTEDTGMFRIWSPDEKYLTEDLTSVLPVNTTIELMFTKYLRTLHRKLSTELPGLWGRTKLSTRSIKANPDDSLTSYNDAILNGIEIFKVSGYCGNLAGPNPDPLPSTPPTAVPHLHSTESTNNRTTIIAVSGGVTILLILGFLIFRLAKRDKDYCNSTQASGSTLPCSLCRYFSLTEIMAATNNFDKVFIIGAGGFGDVYKGYVNDGATPVAIKRLKPGSQQGAQEFNIEIEMLSRLRHLHLVSLIGYCNDDSEMILVYDYMAHGTLRDHLYNTNYQPPCWKQRLQICIGAARGLNYLHTGATHTIIHRDMKSTNILLDDQWLAKVSDFGLSKFGPITSKSHVSTVVKGTFGYLDPEYYRFQQLTEKSDVYSFGVVLCGRPPIIHTTEEHPMGLAAWVLQCYHNGKLDQIVDPSLKDEIEPECLKKFGEIVVNCLLDNGTKRLPMNDVVGGLELALELQESAEKGVKLDLSEEVDMKDFDEQALIPMSDVNESDDMIFSSSGKVSSTNSSSQVTVVSRGSFASKDSDGLMSPRAVFSEIMDPKGR
uniref:Protein kinase domain-containing protein n=1 Tax=Quercus lobata TaxID=97700 RepID=A0A7N2N738_QUELO